MRSYADRRELEKAREERQKEREIKEFNENLKNSSELLNDVYYLFQNVYQLRLKLKQLPKEHLDNILFMAEYFKIERESSNFKYIKPEILNNPLFLSTAIISNPELYFLVSEENQKLFKTRAMSRDREYLKYLTKEDYDNKDLLKNISFGFKGFNESLNCLTKELLIKIIDGPHGEYATRDFLQLDKQQCKNLKSALKPYLEEGIKNKGKAWFENILNKNPYFYTVLNKDEYKDDESKKILISLTGKYNDLFSYLPKEWKEDLSVVVQIINDNSKTEDRYTRFGNNYHNNIKDTALILNEYSFPEKFVEEKFNEMNKLFIRKIYPNLTEDWRKNPLIIKSLFKERDDFEVSLDFCRSIPFEELAENLVNQLKNFKIRTLSEVGEVLEKVVSYHFMKETLVNKNVTEKKLKI